MAIASYRFEWSDGLTESIPVGTLQTTESGDFIFIRTNLLPGSYGTVTITAIDTDGNESKDSSVVSWMVPLELTGAGFAWGIVELIDASSEWVLETSI